MLTRLAQFSILLAFYSFGTFGFFNLFDLRVFVQGLLTVYLVCIVVMRHLWKNKIKMKGLLVLCLFFFTYGLGITRQTGNVATLLESVVMLNVAILILYSPPAFSRQLARLIVLSTCFFCGLVLFSQMYYVLNPDSFATANIFIYSSETGSVAVTPGNFIDYLCFTSGDGYKVTDTILWTRMKGYSNEPSSTIVHYLAPAALALLLGRRYLLLAVFMVVVNIVSISSFLAFLIILSVPAIYLLLNYSEKLAKYAGPVFGAGFVVLLLQGDRLLALQKSVGELLFGSFGFDLLLRKGGSLDARLFSFSDGIHNLITHPLGGSGSTLAGLIFGIAAASGWTGVVIFVVWLKRLFKDHIISHQRGRTRIETLGVSLLVSIVFYAAIVSSYGWDRVPGVIILLLFFRLTEKNADWLPAANGTPLHGGERC